MDVKTQVKEVTEKVEKTTNASPEVKAQVKETTDKVEKTADDMKAQVKEITEKAEKNAGDVKAQVKEATDKAEKNANGSSGVKAQVKETTDKVGKVASDVKTQVMDTAKSAEKLAFDNPVVNTAHSGILAGIGAVAVGKEKTEAVMERLVEKGEVTAKDLLRIWKDLFSQGKEDVTKVEEKLEGMLDQRISAVLQRMNIPNKTDLEGLNDKVGALTKKVADLDKKLAVKKAA